MATPPGSPSRPRTRPRRRGGRAYAGCFVAPLTGGGPRGDLPLTRVHYPSDVRPWPAWARAGIFADDEVVGVCRTPQFLLFNALYSRPRRRPLSFTTMSRTSPSGVGGRGDRRGADRRSSNIVGTRSSSTTSRAGGAHRGGAGNSSWPTSADRLAPAVCARTGPELSPAAGRLRNGKIDTSDYADSSGRAAPHRLVRDSRGGDRARSRRSGAARGDRRAACGAAVGTCRCPSRPPPHPALPRADRQAGALRGDVESDDRCPPSLPSTPRAGPRVAISAGSRPTCGLEDEEAASCARSSGSRVPPPARVPGAFSLLYLIAFHRREDNRPVRHRRRGPGRHARRDSWTSIRGSCARGHRWDALSIRRYSPARDRGVLRLDMPD